MPRFHPKLALADFGSYEASEIGNIRFRGAWPSLLERTSELALSRRHARIVSRKNTGRFAPRLRAVQTAAFGLGRHHASVAEPIPSTDHLHHGAASKRCRDDVAFRRPWHSRDREYFRTPGRNCQPPSRNCEPAEFHLMAAGSAAATGGRHASSDCGPRRQRPGSSDEGHLLIAT